MNSSHTRGSRLTDPSGEVVKNTRLRFLPAIVLTLSVFAILLIIPVAANTQNEYGAFTRDPTHLGNLRWFAGYLSSLGVMAWTTGAAIALFAAGTLRLIAPLSVDSRFLAYFGSLTAVLALDDLYLIHENFFLGEKALFAVYGLIALVGCIMFRRQFQTDAKTFAIAAATFFVGSLLIDRAQHAVQDVIGDFRILFEDGAKFLGAVCWAIFIAKFSASALRHVHQK